MRRRVRPQATSRLRKIGPESRRTLEAAGQGKPTRIAIRVGGDVQLSTTLVKFVARLQCHRCHYRSAHRERNRDGPLEQSTRRGRRDIAVKREGGGKQQPRTTNSGERDATWKDVLAAGESGELGVFANDFLPTFGRQAHLLWSPMDLHRVNTKAIARLGGLHGCRGR